MITSPVKITDSAARRADKAIELRSVGKQYYFKKAPDNNAETASNAFWALKGVSLDIYKGRILGIIGRNGAGKTTLLNIMAGVLSPTCGEVVSTGKVLGLFNLGVGFQDELTGRENIFLNGTIMGASRKGLNVKLADIISFSELGDFIDMPLASYSQGMRLRLGFSIVTHLDFDALVIDEVLAVGDGLFQNKCFEKLADFRRAGKALVVTTQGLDIIQRLCDRAVLLDHGAAIFEGASEEAVNKYRALLNSEKFFVGPAADNRLITTTKKWADDVSCWGNKSGTKEVVIDAVDFINKFGFKCARIKSGEPLKVKVSFTVREDVREPHFGVAIFRKDGVYCYGPNTLFDGYEIPELKKGRGWFILCLKKVLLASGEYRISVAIWDKNETLAFDHHNGYYQLIVAGYENKTGELLNIAARINYRDPPSRLQPVLCAINKFDYSLPVVGYRRQEENKFVQVRILSLKTVDFLEREKDAFITNEYVKFVLELDGKPAPGNNSYYLWLGIFRDDGILCRSFVIPYRARIVDYEAAFPEFPLLPGEYVISAAMADIKSGEFFPGINRTYKFRIVFNRCDHGTVYLRHNWKWTLPLVK